MAIELEELGDPSEEGYYLLDVVEHGTKLSDPSAYRVWFFRLDQFGDGMFDLMFHPSLKKAKIRAWLGPLSTDDMESLDDPTETGHYVCYRQPWPQSTPKYREFAVMVWRNGEWHDSYGWPRPYGVVLGWIGPLPDLHVAPPWIARHEAEAAKEIGL